MGCMLWCLTSERRTKGSEAAAGGAERRQDGRRGQRSMALSAAAADHHNILTGRGKSRKLYASSPSSFSSSTTSTSSRHVNDDDDDDDDEDEISASEVGNQKWWSKKKKKVKGKGKRVVYGFSLVKGKSKHVMEDHHVAQFRAVPPRHELGLFAIFDGHLGHTVAIYLQRHLFDNIISHPKFWSEPRMAILEAYAETDKAIISKAKDLGRGGSTAVTAIVVDRHKLLVANVGDSRAVLCHNGIAFQLSVDHEPSSEQISIEGMGGFVSSLPGDVPRLDGQLAVSRAFGDKSLKMHVRSDPDIHIRDLDEATEFMILASDGLWKVINNQTAVDLVRNIKDPQKATRCLTSEALALGSKDDISCIVVKFK